MSPWSKGRTATKTEHGVAQLHHFGIGRATSFALKGRHRSPSQKHPCTLLFASSIGQARYQATRTLILTLPAALL